MIKTYYSEKELPVVINDKQKDQSYESYDGKNLIHAKTSYECHKGIWITLKQVRKVAKNHSMTIIEAHQWIIHQFDLVKKYTQGRVNMYQTKWISDTIRYHLDLKLKELYDDQGQPIVCHPMTELEEKWIENASKGSSIYHFIKPGTYQDLHHYDKKSAYPFLLIRGDWYLPIHQGEFKFISNEEFQKWYIKARNDVNSDSGFGKGIYHCNVAQSIDTSQAKKFKSNFNGYYTHDDLWIAMREGLKITMSPDAPNFLTYPVKKGYSITPNLLFGEWIQFIYENKLKHPDCKLWKPLISTIHGSLEETNSGHHYQISIDDQESPSYREGETPLDPLSIDGIHFDIPTIKNQHYKTYLARIKPFLFGKMKHMMYKQVLSRYWDQIVEINTDGFTSVGMIPEFEENKTEIGSIIPEHEKDRKQCTFTKLGTYPIEESP